MSSNNIRNIRKVLKLSAQELADILEMSTPNFYAMESGRIVLKEKIVNKLCNIFKCDSYFLTKKELSLEDLSKIKSNYNNVNYNNSIINSTIDNSITNNININNERAIKIINNIKNDVQNISCYCDNKIYEIFTGINNINDEIVFYSKKNVFINFSVKNIYNNLSKYLVIYKNQDIIANIKHLILTDQYELEMDDNKITLSNEEFKNNCEVIGKVVAEVINY